jgi:hypothetical protein
MTDYDTALRDHPTHAANIRTDYATAAQGFDPAFRDALTREIALAIATASLVKDIPVMAVRTGETTEALISCLIAVASMSPHFDQPSHLREFADTLAKRIRRGVAQTRAKPPSGMERFFGFRREGKA